MKPLCHFLVIFLALSLIFSGFGEHSARAALPQENLVIRLFLPDQADLPTLAAELDIWEVHPKAGYLIAAVTESQLAALQSQGYTWAPEPEMTLALQQPRQPLPGQQAGIPGYPCYHTVEETLARAAALAAAYPDLAAWTDIGDSWEKTASGENAGYDLMVLTLTSSRIHGDKPVLLISSALHAREYATAELALRFAEHLAANYGQDPDITWILDHQEVHFLLQANPDGRKQAEAGLLWRKNTNENYCGPTSTSRGADLNRNFAFQWGTAGDSGNPCSSAYRGPSAASEPETQALQAYLTAHFPDRRGPGLDDPAPEDSTGLYLDIHSYGEMVLWPWGFTAATTAPNHDALQTLGRKLAWFNGYEPQQAAFLYPASGATDDYAYGTLGLAAYTIEIGTSFFQDCSSFTTTILPDNLNALLYAARAARAPYLLPAGPDILNPTLSLTSAPLGASVTLQAAADDTRYSPWNGLEPSQPLAAAQFSLDLPFWDPAAAPQPMQAGDGSFDETAEDLLAVIDTRGLSPGRHLIFLHAQDAAGNWGPVRSLFLDLFVPRNLFLPCIIQYN